MSASVLRFTRVTKAFGGLRPLRIAELTVGEGDRVALVGLDGPAAEVFVNLLTGASLPDEGGVELFSTGTDQIESADQWLALLEGLGMVSVRAVLLDDLTVAQNIATAFTLSVDPVQDPVMTDVCRLAAEAGIPASHLEERVAEAAADVKARCHLAKALALNPKLLVLEHANALAPDGAEGIGRTIAAVAKARAMSVLVLTTDEAFAHRAADRVLRVSPATGDVTNRSGWRRFMP